jgi:GNAT superfamily N-acetyltransferase
VATTVREAAIDDVVALLPIWDQLPGTPSVEALLGRIELSLSDNGFKLFVAWEGDAAVGVVCVSLSDVGSWTEVPGVQVSGLHVKGSARHRGVAKALLNAALQTADKWGCTKVVASVPPGDREANRFFARLGFAPAATHRLTDVGSLRKKVSADHKRVVVARMRRASAPSLSARHAAGK